MRLHARDSLRPEELIQRACEALGGQARITSVITYYQQAQVSLQTSVSQEIWTSKLYRARGGKIRIEEDFGAAKRRIWIVNGDVGWAGASSSSDPRLHLSPASESEVQAIKRDTALSPRNLLAHARELKLSAATIHEQEGISYWRLLVKELKAEYLFNPKTYLCELLLDLAVPRTTWYLDYRPVEGISLPWRVESKHSSGLHRIDSIDHAQHNLPLDESLFDPAH